jgi:hypothetical protein
MNLKDQIKKLTMLLIFLVPTSSIQGQTEIKILIPESYELSNIILALTEYGRSDKTEVEKDSRYYHEVLSFFEPVVDHPLLKSANYSRDLWEDYLSFRTDAVAFSFENGILERKLNFFANNGHKPFDKNIQLINDFVVKSNFRAFYKAHQPYYDSIIRNYSSYNMLEEMMAFLKNSCGSPSQKTKAGEYRIILSPLVGRMNCHRDLPGNITADFPALGSGLVNIGSQNNISAAERALDIHTLFTETDHGFVNPITDKFRKEMKAKINYSKWEEESGYPDFNIFNEYMTWALYDVFVLKYFPAIADSIRTQWHYQNGERGFFASSAFAKKVVELFISKVSTETLPDLYPKIITWCSEFQKDLSLPRLASPLDTVTVTDLSAVRIELIFSEPMTEKGSFDINVNSYGEKTTTEHSRVTKEKNNISWSDGGKRLAFTIKLKPANRIVLQTNWWGCKTALESKKGVMLKVYSRAVIKAGGQ